MNHDRLTRYLKKVVFNVGYLDLSYFFLFFFFWPHHAACGILVP